MHRASSFIVVIFLLVGCEASLGARAGEDGEDPGWLGSRPACPIDPDCAIGGACSDYECPEHWECDTDSSGDERCINPGAGELLQQISEVDREIPRAFARTPTAKDEFECVETVVSEDIAHHAAAITSTTLRAMR